MKLKQTEKQLQNAILDYLHIHKICAVPVYNGGVYDPVNKFYRIKKKEYRGTADIWAVKDGWSIAIEVKVGKNILRPEQKEFLLSHHDKGGYSWVIRSIEELEFCLKFFGTGDDVFLYTSNKKDYDK